MKNVKTHKLSDVQSKTNVDFAQGLARTGDCYLENRDWWQRIRDGRYRSERLGIRGAKVRS